MHSLPVALQSSHVAWCLGGGRSPGIWGLGKRSGWVGRGGPEGGRAALLAAPVPLAPRLSLAKHLSPLWVISPLLLDASLTHSLATNVPIYSANVLISSQEAALRACNPWSPIQRRDQSPSSEGAHLHGEGSREWLEEWATGTQGIVAPDPDHTHILPR